MAKMASRFSALFVAAAGVFFYFRPDFLITMLPMYYDGYFVQHVYNGTRHKQNSGVNPKLEPLISHIHPTEMSAENFKNMLSFPGYPVLIKNMVPTNDPDAILRKVSVGTKGRLMRMLSFENYSDPHFSPSCSTTSVKREEVNFDDFAGSHLFTNVSENHSPLYAGFEAITDPNTINDITGLDWQVLGDYKQNNLFTANLPRTIVTAPMHGAPIDSVAIQLIGTKTWFFVSPEDLAEIPNIPMPTAFNLPLTDDELLSRVKKILVVKAEPGDVLYFGPHWFHTVSTSAGPNLMFNFRYNAVPKVMQGPWSFAAKILFRMSTRSVGSLPQDNKDKFPVIYMELNKFFTKCGPSTFFNNLLKSLNLN